MSIINNNGGELKSLKVIKVLMSQITTIMWSLTWSQTSWTVKSSGPYRSITMNKVNEGDGIPADLFKILKDNAVKVLCSIC